MLRATNKLIGQLFSQLSGLRWPQEKWSRWRRKVEEELGEISQECEKMRGASYLAASLHNNYYYYSGGELIAGCPSNLETCQSGIDL